MRPAAALHFTGPDVTNTRGLQKTLHIGQLCPGHGHHPGAALSGPATPHRAGHQTPPRAQGHAGKPELGPVTFEVLHLFFQLLEDLISLGPAEEEPVVAVQALSADLLPGGFP